jgi:hypothetical protein
MGRFTKGGILVEEFGLSSQDFFPYKKDGQELTIVRRAGIEKIAKFLNIRFRNLVVKIDAIPGTFIVHGTIEAGKYLSGIQDVAEWIPTSASAAPQNCIHDRFVEIVENRVKHRAILMLADLHELHVHSEETSNEFIMAAKKHYAPKTKNVKKPEKEPEKGLSKKDEVEKIASLTDSLRDKSSRVKNNRDLLKK